MELLASIIIPMIAGYVLAIYTWEYVHPWVVAIKALFNKAKPKP